MRAYFCLEGFPRQWFGSKGAVGIEPKVFSACLATGFMVAAEQQQWTLIFCEKGEREGAQSVEYLEARCVAGQFKSIQFS